MNKYTLIPIIVFLAMLFVPLVFSLESNITVNLAHNASVTNAGANANCMGGSFTVQHNPDETLYLTAAYPIAGQTINTVYLVNHSNGAVLATATGTNPAIFSPHKLLIGQKYAVVTSVTGSPRYMATSPANITAGNVFFNNTLAYYTSSNCNNPSGFSNVLSLAPAIFASLNVTIVINTTDYFYINALNSYTNANLTNFTATINGTNYTTTNGTINTNILRDNNFITNITIYSNENGGYFNTTYLNYNTSKILIANLSQSQINFIARDIITNAIITNATFNTSRLTNNTHYFNNQNYNISAVATEYNTQTIQYNVTPLLNTTYTFYLASSSRLNISSNIYGTAPRLLRYSATVTNNQYGFSETFTTSNGTVSFNLSPSILYNISIYSYQSNESHLNASFTNYNISQQLTFNYTILNITAKDNLTGVTLGNISQSVTSSNLSGAVAQRTNTANPALFFIYPGFNYLLTTSTPAYNTIDYNIPTVPFGVYNYTVNLSANNSVYFSFVDANTLSTIFTSVTVNLILGNVSLYNCTSTTGNCLIANITPNTYDVVITATGYNPLSGSVVVGNNTYQTFAAYMNTPTALNTIFTIVNQQTFEPITGAIVSIESRAPANPTYTFITTLTSDIVGSVLFNYNASLYYRFTVSASEFEPNTFELKPIIYTSYEIRLRQNITVNTSDAYETLSIQRTPTRIINNQIANFTYFISAPNGNLVFYNYTIFTSYNNSILLQGSGTNAYGEILNNSLYVSSTQLNATIYYATSYILSNGYTASFINVIPVEGTAADYTSVGAGGDRYNLSLFDRLLILTVVIILSGGMAFYFGGVTPGAAVSTLVLSYFTTTNFITPWIGIPSIFLLILFMMRAN